MITWKPTFGDRIASLFFKRQVISETDCEGYRETGHSQNADAYLVRYFVWNDNDNENGIKKPHIYLHHIIKSDPDREHHDHPWNFWSILLWGGYWEETPISEEEIKANYPWHQVPRNGEYHLPDSKTRLIKYDSNTYAIRKWYGPLSLLKRPAEWTHRLYLDKPAWSLVFTRRKRRDWGFYSRFGWILGRNFLAFKCDGRLEEEGNRIDV